VSAHAGRRFGFAADRILLATALLAAALVAWIVTIDRMRGMDAGPGTELGSLGWYLGIWVTMMAAMMLPSAAPMVLLFAKVSSDRGRRGQAFVPTWVFVAGYLATWTAYGLAAFGIYQGIVAAGTGFLAWERQGPIVAGAAIAAAGIYELTPLKNVCLRHCRSPLHFLLHEWREGWRGAFVMGVQHGGYCVGCCFGLMLILFALGVMSLVWMGAIAVVILVQKALPLGRTWLWAFAVSLVAVGVWVAAAPASVPGLVQPDEAPGMEMRMEQGDMGMEGEVPPGGGATPMPGSEDGSMSERPAPQSPDGSMMEEKMGGSMSPAEPSGMDEMPAK
jgi:predicted metal-binding membrane protein